MNKNLLIIILFIIICIIKLSKSQNKIVTTSEFKITDVSQYYQDPTEYYKNVYAIGSTNSFCSYNFYFIIEPLTDKIPKLVYDASIVVNSTDGSNSILFNLYKNSNSNATTFTCDLIIQDYSSINYTIPQFYNEDCISSPINIIPNVMSNQIYKYSYKGSYSSIVTFPNVVKYFKGVSILYGLSYQLSNGFFSGNSGFNIHTKDLLVYKYQMSVNVVGVTDNYGINVTTRYLGGSDTQFQPFYLNPFLTSNTSLMSNKKNIQVTTYPSSCTNLNYGQCVVMIDLEMKSLDYFLFFNYYFFTSPVLISGTPLNGTFYLPIVQRVVGAISINVSSYEVNKFSSTVLENLPISLNTTDPVSYPFIEMKQLNLISNRGDGVVNVSFATQYANSRFAGEMLLSLQKSNNGRLTMEQPTYFPYIRGVENKIELSMMYPVSPYSKQSSLLFNPILSFVNVPGTYGGIYCTMKPQLFDSIFPVLENMEIVDLGIDNDEFAIRCIVSDLGGSGVRQVQLVMNAATGYNFYYNGDVLDLIDGDIFNGTYQFKIPKYVMSNSYTVSIIDNAQNSKSFMVYSPFNGFKRIEPLPYQTLQTTDLKNITFKYNDLDLSDNGSIDNVMFIELVDHSIKNLTFQFVPIIHIEDNTDDNSIQAFNLNYESKFFTSKWNESIQMYQIKFSLPARLATGVVPYKLNPITQADSNSLYSLFGKNCELRVSSRNADIIGPLVDKITLITSSNSVPIPTITDITNIGYILSISDHLNGVNSLDVTISSDKDIIGFNFKFENITGNPTTYSATISIPITSNDTPQSYKISKLILIDGQGFKSYYPKLVHVNPFFKIPTFSTSNDYTITTFYQVLPAIQDITPPSLTSLVISNTNIQDLNRTIIFEFTIQDLESGVSLVNKPVLLIANDNYITFTNDSQIISNVTSTSNPTIYQSVSFRTEITVPHLYGYPNGISTHIFRVYDNARNLIGFSPKNISDLGFQFFIKSSFGVVNPSISSVSLNGNFLIVNGIKFGTAPMLVLENTITQTDTPYYVVVAQPFTNVTSIYLDLTPYISIIQSKQYSISVRTNNGISNSIVIPIPTIVTPTPTITPTPTTQPPLPTNLPSPCKGDPICGGPTKGTCSTSLGCICKSPYFGVDCLSEVILEVIPQVKTTEPVVSIPIQVQNIKSIKDSEKDEKVTSLVSVYSLRELSLSGGIINEYFFTTSSWEYESPLTNEYKFTSNIINKNDETKNTTIIVTIKKFDNETIIQFANQNITMLPNTIKYYITLDNYKFQNNLNTLNLVMYTSIETTRSNNVCSGQEFGDSSSQLSSQYIKIQINDISLYGEFIKRAIVDKVIIGVSNKQTTDSSSNSGNTKSSSKSFIAIEIPNYVSTVELDPSFSVLLENSNKPENSICSDESSGLTKYQLVGIVIGSFVFVVVIIIGIVFITFKSSMSLRIKAKSFKMRHFGSKK